MTVETGSMKGGVQSAKAGLTTHYIVGVLWLSYWMTNSYIWLADLAPFLDYYVMTTLFLMYYSLTRPNQVLRFIMHPLLWFWALTAVIPVLVYLSGVNVNPYSWSEIVARIVFFSALASAGLILSDENGSGTLRSAATISLAITLVVFFGELFIHNPYARAYGRSAGFFGDPNIAGGAAISMLLLSQDIRKQTPRRLMIVGITLVGVVTTLSRSAMVFAALVAAAYLFLPQGRGTLSLANRLLVLFAGVILIPLTVLGATVVLDLDTTESWRISSILTLDTTDASSQGRLEFAMFALNRAAEFFWTGRGSGASSYYSVYAHNTYLTILYEYGIMGLVVFLLAIAHGYCKVWQFGLQRSLTAVALTTQIAWISLFDHTVASQSMIALIFAALMTNAIISPKAKTAVERGVTSPISHPPAARLPSAARLSYTSRPPPTATGEVNGANQ
jgi:hypothetical protein